jgi:hypothetical protein
VLSSAIERTRELLLHRLVILAAMGGVALLGMVDGPWFMCAIILLAFVLAFDSEKRAVAAEEALAALRTEPPLDSMAVLPGRAEPEMQAVPDGVVRLRDYRRNDTGR